MITTKESELREEWNEIESDERKEMSYDEVADWWLQKRKEELQSLIGELEAMKIHYLKDKKGDVIGYEIWKCDYVVQEAIEKIKERI